jgi:hypothetical protein
VQRKKTFLVVWLSILTSPLWAQIAPVGVLKNSGLMVGASAVAPISFLKVEGLGQGVRGGVGMVLLPPLSMTQMIDAGALYGCGNYLGSLGFFCKKEIQIENTIHLPLRLRLGSLQEVNRLEGKPGW